ncbi:DNA cytosine methyltransferase [Streptomyces longwoodensis]|uniref:DNA cytosine methyltransferase n=1 Tax=Streptomyces longwoodensis TaxID=68231 RepID=UPI0033C6F613
MSFLYPRLLAEQARPLFDEYHALTVAELSQRVALAHESSVYVATGGDRIPSSRLRELRESVLDLAKHAGFPDESDRGRNAEFDLRLAALLHSEMGMVPAEAAARDIWAFLALILLPDVAFWRYPQPPKDRILGTDLTRHVFGRLWWRAQLVREPGGDSPYHALEILGEAAFDQIYARRAALGGSPHLVRAILRVWNSLDLKGLNERRTLQDFLKRLLRLAPFVLFDGIEEGALDDELRAVAQESVDAQRSGAARAGEAVAATSDMPTAPSDVAEDPSLVTDEPSRPVPEQLSPGSGPTRRFTSVEICAGAGGQALGLERAGFDPVLLIDSKADACFTIDRNRPDWDVVCIDVLQFSTAMRPDVVGVDLVSAGLPRVKSSATVGRIEDATEREVLRATIQLACDFAPKALLFENVPELVGSPAFAEDRAWIENALSRAGFKYDWAVLNAADYGVPQNRSSGFLVALRDPYFDAFSWPRPHPEPAPSVGQVLGPSMASGGWPGAERWIRNAGRTAPALVGGSDRRGGADLGPTGSKKAWEALGVNGNSLGDQPPGPDFPVEEHPKLTVEQAAAIQAFPPDWQFVGGKTSRYRQIGHAMPPPLAAAVGHALAAALRS